MRFRPTQLLDAPHRLLLLGGQLGPGAAAQPGQRLAPVHRGGGGHPVRRRGGQPQQGGGERGLGAVERHQVHRGDGAAVDTGDGFADHPLGRGELGQAGADQIGGNPEDLRGVRR